MQRMRFVGGFIVSFGHDFLAYAYIFGDAADKLGP